MNAAVEQVQCILDEIADTSLGGSGRGVAYQDYPWPPFNTIPAAFHSTEKKLGIIKSSVELQNKSVLDFGCANGAVTIGLALAGARAYGVDAEPKQLGAGRIIAAVLKATAEFSTELHADFYDVIVFLSVWKWLVRHQGRELADSCLRRLAASCDVLLFDAGVGDLGTDLDAGLTVSAVPSLVRGATCMKDVILAGAFIDNFNIPRTIWRCQK